MIVNERKSIFRVDVMRSIFIVSVLFVSIFAVKKNYLSRKYLIPVLTIFVLADLSFKGTLYQAHISYAVAGRSAHYYDSRHHSQAAGLDC